MKKILIAAAYVFALGQFGCKNDIVDGSNRGTGIILNYPARSSYSVAASGLTYFDKALFGLKDAETDTISLEAVIPYPLSKDVTISIAADEAALTAYNNDPANETKYLIAPAENYTIVNPSATLKAGKTELIFKIAIKPQQFDIGNTGYMLPVSITGDPGIGVYNEMKTVYLHVAKAVTIFTDLLGDVIIDDPNFWEGSMPGVATKVDYNTMNVSGWFETMAYSCNIDFDALGNATITKQVVGPTLPTTPYTNPAIQGSGSYNASTVVLSLSLGYSVDQGSFGSGFGLTIHK